MYKNPSIFFPNSMASLIPCFFGLILVLMLISSCSSNNKLSFVKKHKSKGRGALHSPKHLHTQQTVLNRVRTETDV